MESAKKSINKDSKGYFSRYNSGVKLLNNSVISMCIKIRFNLLLIKMFAITAKVMYGVMNGLMVIPIGVSFCAIIFNNTHFQVLH